MRSVNAFSLIPASGPTATLGYTTLTSRPLVSVKRFSVNSLRSYTLTNNLSFQMYIGNETVLANEIYREKRYGNVYSLIRANGPTMTPGNTTLTNIHVDGDRSLVSVMTMIFPSPDWFLGIANVNLCDNATGEWKQNLTRDLFPYDAGTDNGTSFESANSPSDPRQNITLISKDDDTNFRSDNPIRRLGTFTFTRIPTKTCKGKAYYTLTFNAEWSNITHPSPVFPKNAMFSPLIGASHSMYYEMWRRGKMASTGVRIVAETGKRFLSKI